MASYRYRYRPVKGRPEIVLYWSLVDYLAGPGGDRVAVHRELQAAGVAPRYARLVTGSRKARPCAVRRGAGSDGPSSVPGRAPPGRAPCWRPSVEV